MQVHMLDHHQKWIFHYMKTHKQLDQYNVIWFSMSACHNLTPTIKPTEDVDQWIEKEIKVMSSDLVRIVSRLLRGGRPAQCPIFSQ